MVDARVISSVVLLFCFFQWMCFFTLFWGFFFFSIASIRLNFLIVAQKPVEESMYLQSQHGTLEMGNRLLPKITS